MFSGSARALRHLGLALTRTRAWSLDSARPGSPVTIGTDACACAGSALAEMAADPADLLDLAALLRLDPAALAALLADPRREHESVEGLIAALMAAAPVRPAVDAPAPAVAPTIPPRADERTSMNPTHGNGTPTSPSAGGVGSWGRVGWMTARARVLASARALGAYTRIRPGGGTRPAGALP